MQNIIEDTACSFLRPKTSPFTYLNADSSQNMAQMIYYKYTFI